MNFFSSCLIGFLPRICIPHNAMCEKLALNQITRVSEFVRHQRWKFLEIFQFKLLSTPQEPLKSRFMCSTFDQIFATFFFADSQNVWNERWLDAFMRQNKSRLDGLIRKLRNQTFESELKCLLEAWDLMNDWRAIKSVQVVTSFTRSPLDANRMNKWE